MSLFIGDTLCCEKDGKRILYHILGITDQKITMAELFEAGNLKERDKNKTDYFKYTYKKASTLKPLKARIVHVDECGFVYDPGFKEK